MKDDILKFRRICKEKYKNEAPHKINGILQKELELTTVPVDKLLDEDVKELKIRASTLGKVQDFNKANSFHLMYEGIESEKKNEESNFWELLNLMKDNIPSGVQVVIKINGDNSD